MFQEPQIPEIMLLFGSLSLTLAIFPWELFCDRSLSYKSKSQGLLLVTPSKTVIQQTWEESLGFSNQYIWICQVVLKELLVDLNFLVLIPP
jgi:hypothetical protein